MTALPAAPAPTAPGWPWPPDYVPTLAEIDAVCPEYAAAVRWLAERVIRRELNLGPEWVIEDAPSLPSDDPPLGRS